MNDAALILIWAVWFAAVILIVNVVEWIVTGGAA